MDDNPYQTPRTRDAFVAPSSKPRRPLSATSYILLSIGAMIGAGAGLAVACVLVMFVGFFIFGWPDNDLEGGKQARIDNLQAVQMCLILICPAIGAVVAWMITSALSRTFEATPQDQATRS